MKRNIETRLKTYSFYNKERPEDAPFYTGIIADSFRVAVNQLHKTIYPAYRVAWWDPEENELEIEKKYLGVYRIGYVYKAVGKPLV